jgi:hypothetical protein
VSVGDQGEDFSFSRCQPEWPRFLEEQHVRADGSHDERADVGEVVEVESMAGEQSSCARSRELRAAAFVAAGACVRIGGLGGLGGA